MLKEIFKMNRERNNKLEEIKKELEAKFKFETRVCEYFIELKNESNGRIYMSVDDSDYLESNLSLELTNDILNFLLKED